MVAARRPIQPNRPEINYGLSIVIMRHSCQREKVQTSRVFCRTSPVAPVRVVFRANPINCQPQRAAEDMILNRTAIALALLMVAASAGAILARPSTKAADQGPKISLEAMVPKAFGGWQEEPQRIGQVVNPQTQELLDKLYSQILARTYINASGYRVMLSLAYGSDQRGELQAHKPEVCYPAQGFKLHSTKSVPLETPAGQIPAQRLMTSLGPRHEPVTYWFTVGDKAVQSKLEKRLVQIAFGLTGRIPDGLLFRVSSIDQDATRAYGLHDQFVNAMLAAVPPVDRARLSGLSADARPPVN